MSTPLRALPRLGACLLAGASLLGCREGVRASSAGSEAPVVSGATLDAETGEPLVGVLVEGPRGARAVSDPAGRFELIGLKLGDQGVLSASRGAEYRGELPLRPLAEGRLEVVFHLREARE
jgi:hypothetical protein